MKILLFWLVFLMPVFVLGQVKTVRVERVNGSFKLEYDVLVKDTTIKDGQFCSYYKNKLIEKGNYKLNNRVGSWLFFNLDGIFEFEYDFNNQRVVKLSGERDHTLSTPCLFKGSPLIPHFYIVQKLFYPRQSVKDSLSGEVVLALKINKEGEVWAMYLAEKLSPEIDAEVMKVARDFPNYWQWIPATKFGQPIDSEYLITISFELTP